MSIVLGFFFFPFLFFYGQFSLPLSPFLWTICYLWEFLFLCLYIFIRWTSVSPRAPLRKIT